MVTELSTQNIIYEWGEKRNESTQLIQTEC